MELTFSYLTRNMEADVAEWFIDSILERGGATRDDGDYASRISYSGRLKSSPRPLGKSVDMTESLSMIKNMRARWLGTRE